MLVDFSPFSKMKIVVLLAFIPSLIAADILCPNSKTTCPEDKQCCEVDGEYSCCEPDDDQDVPARRLKVYAGAEIKGSTAFANLSFSDNNKLHYGGCDSYSCQGTCCSNSWDGCCPYSRAVCCGGDTCCPALTKCCNGGCCRALQSCCGKEGCCDEGYDCCGFWCCRKGHKCGKKFMTCGNKGAAISPAIVAVLMLAASVFISQRL